VKPGWSTFAWSVVGTAVIAALMWLAFRNQHAPEQFLLRARRLELVARLRGELAAQSEAEKSAVLAITDAESQKYADEARARAQDLERDRAELGRLLEMAPEKELLEAFSKQLSDLQRIDAEVLALAVKNTNLKASALAFGPAAEAMNELDGALARLVAANAQSSAPNAKKVMLSAARAEAAALRIALLLPPHIAEESNAKMDALEAVMAREDAQVKQDLKELGAWLPSNADVAKATASYARFSELRKQILALSRENTNVRSLSLSLNQKRKQMFAAEDALAALEKSIAAEPAGATPPKPR
jgi:hypothetical protein